MAKIKVLSEEIASKIAAGEVVQRPESVVKELIENAIDACAKSIEVEVKDAGKSFIRVSDNGTGMVEQDALLAFQQHATSKIATYGDLENISTLGFRGEALYSIAAVSQVELKTKTESEDAGTYLRIDGGKMGKASKVARDAGTTVVVRNLFFNTPARRNFLKGNSTEFRHIYQTLSRYAIAFPEIQFMLQSGDEVVLRAKSSTVKERLDEIFGDKFTDSLVAFDEDFDHLKVRGFLGKPEYTKRTRGEQFLFLNKRYVINKAVNHAAFSAYENLIDKGDFPFFAIFIELPPNEVDVNVHPSKLEVKFRDERSIYGAIRSATRSALVRSDLVPELAVGGDSRRFVPKGTSWTSRATTESSRGGFVPVMFSSKPSQQQVEDGRIADAVDPLFALKLPQNRTTGDERSADGEIVESSGDLIYQLHNKYIISQISTGLLVVDQHAAHERIIYERALKRFDEQGQNTQQLLFPISLNLDPADLTIVEEIIPDLNKMGFSVKVFSGGTVILDGVPVDLKPGRENTILNEIIEDYKRDNDLRLTPREKLCKTFACKAAVKAGDYLTTEEMESLLAQLFKAEVPYVCPHGRPVLVKIPLLELDKKFGRI
ncbi:MAG TPA: DNA mismatch repair endonuclease MutL [Candidatus Acidoferrales bacterium]|nr:DNA mismatch repair endonuclease MutL [Candidatus Acidoferrales bacterium]